jgi:predicted metal-dependent HD superfamily phosphohydrolase
MHPAIPMSLISRLIPRYSEPHRHYHTWHHIAEVFDASEQISTDKSLELTLAILFHDAVYNPLAKDNEERSAELLIDEGKRAEIDVDVLQDAVWLVLQTRHLGGAVAEPSFDAVADERASVLLDADLSILGSEPKIFDLYDRAIRQEYSAVSDHDFAEGRAKFVKGMLNRKTIFRTAKGQELWESQARRNLYLLFDIETARARDTGSKSS